MSDLLSVEAEIQMDDEITSRHRRAAGGLAAALALVTAVSLAWVLLGSPSRISVGLLSMTAVVALMLLGVPIAIAMLGVSIIGIYALLGTDGVISTIANKPFEDSASWQLSVIPMFILMGVLLSSSGAIPGVFRAARLWLGGVPGGLAVATNFSGAGLAAASGSSIGISYALGRIGIPEMLKAGYKPSLATGVVAAAGTLGQLIPPSIMLVIYAGMAQTAVGPQLLAAVVPGVILATAYAAMIIVRCALNPELGPATRTSEGLRVKLGALLATWPVPFIMLIVIGGMYSGLLTATEAGAVGAVGAGLVLVIGKLQEKDQTARASRRIAVSLARAMRDVVAPVASIMLLIVAVSVLTRLLTITGVVREAVNVVVGLDLGRVEFLLVMIVVYLILGMLMDPIAALMLTVPVALPILAALGIDAMWFGVFAVLLVEIGVLSPPIGVLTFVIHRLSQDPRVSLGQHISLTTVFSGVMWFMLMALLVILLLIAVPDLALWLPNSSG